MQYADAKLREEEDRARRYLDTNQDESLQKVDQNMYFIIFSSSTVVYLFS